MAIIAIRGRDGRAQLVQVSDSDLRSMRTRAQALAKQSTTPAGTAQSARFRNAPTTGVKVAAELGSLALTMGTGTGIVGPFVSALLRDLLMRKADFTIGKQKSPLRAMPGLPFGGIRNVRTGQVTKPQSIAQIVAAARTAVSRAVATGGPGTARSPVSPNAISAAARANVAAQLARVGGSASSMFSGGGQGGGSKGGSSGGGSPSGGGNNKAGSDRGSGGTRGFR